MILSESKGNPVEQSKMIPEAWVTWADVVSLTGDRKYFTDLNHCNKYISILIGTGNFKNKD